MVGDQWDGNVPHVCAAGTGRCFTNQLRLAGVADKGGRWEVGGGRPTLPLDFSTSVNFFPISRVLLLLLSHIKGTAFVNYKNSHKNIVKGVSAHCGVTRSPLGSKFQGLQVPLWPLFQGSLMAPVPVPCSLGGSRAPSPSPSQISDILNPSPTRQDPTCGVSGPLSPALPHHLCPHLQAGPWAAECQVGHHLPRSQVQSLVKPVVDCHRNNS